MTILLIFSIDILNFDMFKKIKNKISSRKKNLLQKKIILNNLVHQFKTEYFNGVQNHGQLHVAETCTIICGQGAEIADNNII